MACAILAGRVLNREGHPVLSLSLAALVLLVFCPAQLFTVGFQLSFAAVLGLLWTAETFDRPWQAWLANTLPPHPLRRIVAALGSALIATTGASLATAPLVLLHFGQTPLLGVVANLWVVPVVSYLLLPLAASALLVLPLAPSLAGTLVQWAAIVEHHLVLSVEVFVQCCPAISLNVSGWPLHHALLLAAFVLGVLRARRGFPARALACFALIALIAAVGLRAISPPHTGTLRVTFLPVGQGDATLIETPDGQTILIDGGGDRRRDPGAFVITPALHALGHTHLDMVILTHPDFDHYGGLAHVVHTFRPREVWTNGQVDKGSRYAAFEAAIALVGSVHRVARADPDPIPLGGGASMTVLAPLVVEPERGKNDNSVVVRLDHGDVSFLLPGDPEREGEEMLLKAGAPLGATVLKAGHHGSQTSSTEAFLNAVQPRYVVYAVGARNRFGLPHPDVLRRFIHRGVVDLRTDRDGAIRMETDGTRLTVDVWQP